MNDDILNKFIDDILSHDNIQLYSLFASTRNNDDLLCTFFGFLISKCIIRYARPFTTLSVYEFSKPGRVMMEDKIKRIIFIEEFKKFYDN